MHELMCLYFLQKICNNPDNCARPIIAARFAVTRSYLSRCNKFHTCHTRDGDILTVSTVVNAPPTVTARNVITRNNVTFVAIAHSNPSAPATVAVANEPTDASFIQKIHSHGEQQQNNNKHNTRLTANFDNNLHKPVSEDKSFRQRRLGDTGGTVGDR